MPLGLKISLPSSSMFFFFVECRQSVQQLAYTASSHARLRRYRRRLQFTTCMNWKLAIWRRIGWKGKNEKENGSITPQRVLGFSGNLNFYKGWFFPPWVSARSFMRKDSALFFWYERMREVVTWTPIKPRCCLGRSFFVSQLHSS